MSMLELRDVSKIYGHGAAQVTALSEISLTVDAGAMVAVMGPSGSGKSTLLTIAGSLEDPTRGEVRIGGTSLGSMSRNDKARLRRRTVGTAETSHSHRSHPSTAIAGSVTVSSSANAVFGICLSCRVGVELP